MVYLFVGGQECLTPIFNTFQNLFWPGSVSNVVDALRESIYFRQPGEW